MCKDKPWPVSGPAGLSACQCTALPPALPHHPLDTVPTLGRLDQNRGKNTNWFPNNTFLSTTQTQQGQNERQCHHSVKVKVPESFAESRAASCERSPCPWPRTKWAPEHGADSDRIRWASPERGSNCMVSACAGLLVAFLSRVQSGQASCPKRISCSEMSTWKVSPPHAPWDGLQQPVGVGEQSCHFSCRSGSRA